MFSDIVIKVRAAVLAVLAILSGVGLVPAGLEEVISANADKVIGGIMGVWAILAWFTRGAVNGNGGSSGLRNRSGQGIAEALLVIVLVGLAATVIAWLL